MRFPNLAFSVLCCIPLASLATPRVVQVADGDDGAFAEALCAAARGEFQETVIHLAERGYYTPGRAFGWPGCARGGRLGILPLPPAASDITTSVTIRGGDAILDLERTHGFKVHPGGRLTLEFLELRNGQESPTLNNQGEAVLRGVAIIGHHATFDPITRWATVHNDGRLEIRNSILAENGLTIPTALYTDTSPFEGCTPIVSGGILNRGELVANNVSFLGNFTIPGDDPVDGLKGDCAVNDLANAPGARATVSNSVISSQPGVWADNCRGEFQSLGYNSVPAGGECGFNAPGDEVEFFSFVFHVAIRQNGRTLFVPDARFRPEGYPPASPEPLGSSPSACETSDVRGYLRKPDRCDRGAFDAQATPDLNVGFDGLWFDPDNDGQYLHLSHFGHGRVLLLWTSFDADGNPVWVYGVGEPAGGNQIEVDAFRNTGVQLTEGMLLGQVQAEPWGSLTVRIRSCARLDFAFVSPDPASGTGAYTLRRLTDNAAAGCFDQKGALF